MSIGGKIQKRKDNYESKWSIWESGEGWGNSESEGGGGKVVLGGEKRPTLSPKGQSSTGSEHRN